MLWRDKICGKKRNSSPLNRQLGPIKQKSINPWFQRGEWGLVMSSALLIAALMDGRSHPLHLHAPERWDLAKCHVISLFSSWWDVRNKLPPLQCQRNRKYSLYQSWILLSLFYKICRWTFFFSTYRFSLSIIDTFCQPFSPLTFINQFFSPCEKKIHMNIFACWNTYQSLLPINIVPPSKTCNRICFELQIL